MTEVAMPAPTFANTPRAFQQAFAHGQPDFCHEIFAYDARLVSRAE
jgi:hypothetical protein